MTRDWARWAALLPLLMAPLTPATAQLPSNSMPSYLADDDLYVGLYRFEEEGTGERLAAEVELNADRTARYVVTVHDGHGDRDAPVLNATGFWAVTNGIVHIHNHPGPVRLDASGEPTRDPAGGLEITVATDGVPANSGSGDEPEVGGLGVTWPGADGLFMLSDGRHTVDADGLKGVEHVVIVRAADRLPLATVPLIPGGPNRFAFTYHPSDQEPFDFTGFSLDERAEQLEVELGTAAVKLTRVPARP